MAKVDSLWISNTPHTSLQVLCLLTWAGLALTAPQRLRSPALESSGLVDTILAQLDTPINQAIEAALSGLYGQQYSAPVLTSFTGTVSQSPAITVQTSGTVSSTFDSDDDFEGSAFSSEGTFNGFSTSGGQSSSFAANSFSEDSSSTSILTLSQRTQAPSSAPTPSRPPTSPPARPLSRPPPSPTRAPLSAKWSTS